jgi:hypothetical protein
VKQKRAGGGGSLITESKRARKVGLTVTGPFVETLLVSLKTEMVQDKCLCDVVGRPIGWKKKKRAAWSFHLSQTKG